MVVLNKSYCIFISQSLTVSAPPHGNVQLQSLTKCNPTNMAHLHSIERHNSLNPENVNNACINLLLLSLKQRHFTPGVDTSFDHMREKCPIDDINLAVQRRYLQLTSFLERISVVNCIQLYTDGKYRTFYLTSSLDICVYIC